MTGKRSEVERADVHTFRVRQSSLTTPLGCGCGHWGPNCVASLILRQTAGSSGGRQRSRLTGAAAYGMPLNDATSPPAPRKRPVAIVTVRSRPWLAGAITSARARKKITRPSNCVVQLVVLLTRIPPRPRFATLWRHANRRDGRGPTYTCNVRFWCNAANLHARTTEKRSSPWGLFHGDWRVTSHIVLPFWDFASASQSTRPLTPA